MFPRMHTSSSRDPPHALAVSSAPSASAAFLALILELMDLSTSRLVPLAKCLRSAAFAAAAGSVSPGTTPLSSEKAKPAFVTRKKACARIEQ